MTDPERTTNFKPSPKLLKRIDIGLTTGIIAVIISFLALLTSYKQIQMAQESQKASVLPIIAVALGYNVDEMATFDITLTNEGAGIAHVRRVRALIKGEVVEDDQTFALALMNGRMLSNARLREEPAAGFLPPGESRTPWSFLFGSSAANRGEINAYLRGQYGPPLDGVDIEVCYCSVFDDCWESSFLDRSAPRKVRHCGVNGGVDDVFQTFMEARAARRLAE